MKKLITLIFALALPYAAYAAPVSWDGNVGTGILQPLQSLWSSLVKADHFQATSTKASIFPYASTTATTVNGPLFLGSTATTSAMPPGTTLWNGTAFYSKNGTATTSINAWWPTLGGSNIDVFLIAGQSNAVGAASDCVGCLVPEFDTVYKFNKGLLAPGVDPVGNTNNGSAWPQFGITYNKLTGHRVLFVDAALGGTGQILASDSGSGNWSPTDGTLFSSSLALLSNATSSATAAGFTPHFMGILWVQGENDGVFINSGAETKATYKSGLTTMIAQYRTNLGSSTPFFIFRTGMYNPPGGAQPDYPGLKSVRDAQEEVAEADTNSFVVFRNAVDFAWRGLMQDSGTTPYHYLQAGYNEMGKVGAEGVVQRFSSQYWHPQSSNLLFDLSSSSTHVIIGVGTTTPSNQSYALEVIGDITNYARNAFMALTQFGSQSGLYLKRSGGTVDAKTALPANTILGGVYGVGYGGTGDAFNATSSAIEFNTAENQTATAHGSYLTFSTMPNSTNAASITNDTATSTAIGTGVTTLTFNHTVDAGSNKMLLCSVTYASQNDQASSVTYGGTALTRKVREGGNTSSAELWYLSAPTVGTASVVATFGAAINGAVGCSSYSNVDPTTPFGEPQVDTGSALATAVLNTSTASGYVVIDVLGKRAGNEAASASFSSMSGLLATTTAASGGAEMLRTTYTLATTTATYTGWSWPTTARGYSYLSIPLIPTQNTPKVLTERLRVDSAGNVGIGTTSPYRTLSIVGSGVFTGGDVLASTLNATSTITAGATTTATYFAASTLGTVGAPAFTFSNDLNTGLWSPTLDTLALSTGGTELLRITATGLVGIGTTTPSVKLHVAANTGNAENIALEDTSTGVNMHTYGLQSRNGVLNIDQMNDSNATTTTVTISTSTVPTLILGNSASLAGFGTTTPQWMVNIVKATTPQLTLGDGTNTNPWSFRSVGSELYIGTSSPTTFATSTGTVLSFNANGNATFSGSVSATNITASTTKTYTATYDPASLAANTSRCDDVSVTSITVGGGAVSVAPGVDPNGSCVIAAVRNTTADQVRVCWRNTIDAVTACDTTTSTWKFTQTQ